MGKFPLAAPSNTLGLRTLTGPVLDQQSLLPHPSLSRFPSFHLRLRHRPPPDGLLELRHLHHNLLGRRAVIIQRKAERE